MFTQRGYSGRVRRGFTLVELLVVIAIIGILAAILVPAVLAARAHARRTVCMNNQLEIGKAIQIYESTKQHFPGYINPGAGTPNWVKVLLPYLGRGDLWSGANGAGGWQSGAGTSVFIPQLVCPEDSGNAAPTIGLSYVVNANVCKDRSAGNGSNDLTSAQLTAPQQTVMVGELVSGDQPKAGPWDKANDLAHLAFTWPAGGGALSTCLSTNHPNGMVVVIFFDGHADFLPDTTSTGSPYVPGP